MKQKKIFILAAAALAFAACSSDESPTAPEEQQTGAAYTQGDVPVAFDVYVNRGTTRAGFPGEMTTDALKTGALKTEGFGVFAYHTDNEAYSETAIPNFMFNQQVKYVGSDWTYSPLKYWPNEFGSTASSNQIDYLTFFAYAPWVDAEAKTGIVANTTDTSTGIIGFSRNTTKGDPFVKYAIDFNPAKCVDLCWGVANANFSSSVDGTENTVLKDQTFINVKKPKTGDVIRFNFKHALAALNVQIDADVDAESPTHTTNVEGTTRIYVRSVTFEGFAAKGALNLNSDATSLPTPIWYDVLGLTQLSTAPVTLFDGRKDGREGVSNGAATYEMPQGLNTKLVQIDKNTQDGVQKEAVNLFNSATESAPIYVIPTGQNMKVTIVYDVETVDDKLPTFISDGKTHGSVVENVITKEIVDGSSDPIVLESGKLYTISLHLGMTSVKFEATESTWPTAPGEAADADLPINKE